MNLPLLTTCWCKVNDPDSWLWVPFLPEPHTPCLCILRIVALHLGVLYVWHQYTSCFTNLKSLKKTNYIENENLRDLFESEDRDDCVQQPGGIYCMAQFILYEGPVRFLYNSTQGDSENTIQNYNNLKVNRGVCLTSTCKNYVQNTNLEIKKDLENALQRCVSTAMSNKYDLFAKAYNINCDTQLDSGYRIDSTDNIVAAIFIALILANVIGSCYDIFHRKDEKKYKKGHNLLLCFSIFRNYKILSLEIFSHVKSRVFRDLHAVRTMTACSLIYVNVLYMEHYGFKPRAVEKFGSISYRMSPSGLIIVQIFYFVSGFLVTLLTQPKIFKISIISKILFLRWFRLAVSAALVMAFSATWLRHVSSGSQWIHNTAEHCRLHYWAHLFYYNNHLPNNTMCSFQTWFMTADTQLHALGLFIRFIFNDRSAKFKGMTFGLLLLIGIVSPALHIWFQDLDVSQSPEIYSVLYELTFLKLHMLPNNNLICLIMSMATGYLVSYLIESKTEWPNWKTGRFLCWCVIPGIAVVVLLSGGRWWGAALSGAAAAAVGALCSLWILGTAMKFNDPSALLNGQRWVALSKLSYSVYLLHPIVVFLVSEKSLVHEDFANTNTIFIVVLLATYALALPFYLLVKSPLKQIIVLVIYSPYYIKYK